jgi:hypothetical protein
LAPTEYAEAKKEKPASGEKNRNNKYHQRQAQKMVSAPGKKHLGSSFRGAPPISGLHEIGI